MSDPKNDEFSLESILAEFSGDSTPNVSELDVTPEFSVKDPADGETQRPTGAKEVKSEPDQEASPDKNALFEEKSAPANETEPEKAEAPEDASPIQRIRIVTTESTETSDEKPSDEGAADTAGEASENIISNIRRASVNSRHVPTPEELRMGNEDDSPQENVIDASAFDEAYNGRQKSFNSMRKQLRANDQAVRRLHAQQLFEKRIYALVPATLRSGAIPMPKALRNKKPINPDALLRKYDNDHKNFTIRFIICLLLCLPQLYMTAAGYLHLPCPGFMNFSTSPVAYTLLSLLLLALSILTAYDVYFGGCYSLITLHATPDSLVFVSSIASIGHAIVCMLDRSVLYNAASGSMVYAPVCVLSSVGLLFGLLNKCIAIKTYRKCLIRTHRMRTGYTLSPLKDKYDNEKVYSCARVENVNEYFRSFMETTRYDRFMFFFAPIVTVLSVVAALFCVKFGKNETTFFWDWSVIIGFTPALGFFLTACLPYHHLSKKLAKINAFTGGPEACLRMGKRAFVIYRDTDLFPVGTIKLKASRPADAGDVPLVATASVLSAAKTALALPFTDMVKEKALKLAKVTDLEISDNGGYKAMADGRSVLLGSVTFMKRNEVAVPEGITLRTALCCAIDGKLAVVYAMNYNVNNTTDYAISLLDRNGYIPILATRDAAINPELIQDRFGIPAGELIYPSAELRELISAPGNTLPCGGVLAAKMNNNVMAQSVVGCHRFASSSRLILIFSVISSLLGLVFGIVMSFFGWYEAATPVNMLLYYLLWVIPALLFARWVNWY